MNQLIEDILICARTTPRHEARSVRELRYIVNQLGGLEERFDPLCDNHRPKETYESPAQQLKFWLVPLITLSRKTARTKGSQIPFVFDDVVPQDSFGGEYAVPGMDERHIRNATALFFQDGLDFGYIRLDCIGRADGEPSQIEIGKW